MDNYVSVIFCRNCKSRFVDAGEWTRDGKVVMRCRSCNAQEELSHFTLGRGRISITELQNARDTMAKKDRYER